jgi:glycosyltransferase involved in cell wall biosynthesis
VETFSVVTLEAILSGRPVIATRCGGPEAFILPENGLLIDRDDDAQLANAMQQLLRNYSFYESGKVKNSLPGDYSLKGVGETINTLYHIALQKR